MFTFIEPLSVSRLQYLQLIWIIYKWFKIILISRHLITAFFALLNIGVCKNNLIIDCVIFISYKFPHKLTGTSCNCSVAIVLYTRKEVMVVIA